MEHFAFLAEPFQFLLLIFRTTEDGARVLQELGLPLTDLIRVDLVLAGQFVKGDGFLKGL